MKDTLIKKLIVREVRRQRDTLNLIPSENIVSEDVLSALGSELTNKYAEGYPGARYYGGNSIVDEIEETCRSRALSLFRLSPAKWSVNVQPYSGSPANLAVYAALVPLGQKIMGLQLDMGGHLTHGHRVSFTGKAWNSVPYVLKKKTERLDYEELMRVARREKPQLIVAGYTAYSRHIDFKKFRKIADSAGSILMVDMSHFAGLVAGGAYPSPFPHADIVTTTTHKTLRGPRGAMIFSRREFSRAIDKAVFPGLQGGPHVNQIAAAAVALAEAKQPAFRAYARRVVLNARVLADALKKNGWRIVSGGTDTHLLLVDVAARGIGGREASDRLEENGIIVNMNTIPFDARPPRDPSGIRLGTPAVTTRGMKEREMKKIAELITAVLISRKNAKRIVSKLCADFPHGIKKRPS